MIAGIIGATGYAGAEITRILLSHPKVDALALSSTSFEGEDFANVYPNFFERIHSKLEKPERIIEKSDVVFAALPNGVSEQFAVCCVKKGIPFIDMSADFRFDDDEETYKAWYGKPYQEAELHRLSVYGLCEFNRSLISEKSAPVIIGNPGCYPTCASLAAWPALAKHLAASGETIIINAASGVTGGGREPQRSYHFPECNDSFTAYKTGNHRHTPEIARNFSKMEGGAGRNIIFTPHLAPMNRGILAALYVPLAKEYRITENSVLSEASLSAGPLIPVRPPSKEIMERAAALHAVYADFYAKERFVRVLPFGLNAATNRVRGSNYCDISIHIDQSGAVLIVMAAIDNMIKGAAGQAVQNMNILFGFNEAEGLEYQGALF
ncbi:MAG: N-acetyl-gamma-glutamyl-phosphate reductase [Spirochaetaceae bacterium]|jgi:N-acetyl-gamma-glutamyl-phosphate reductase|nr:N-acetyl-gamma-glutamyl-phosphate reductase [Spirochaetaceae bacterium]